MTKLFEEGIEAVKNLPRARQDVAGEFLLAIAEQNARSYSLSEEQVKEVKRRQQAFKRGKEPYVSDKEMARLWKKLGL
ncbi:hypothetical protein A2851_04570 [Candidatus Kaiserbacteria bacterium RIFCSPHIGHO2_01_FULL_53_29]|uniref:Uncharacterized protein n=1 Tax=Candidatus Kaiserbacteria bacterium RIFCSPHIGHO2_01_FULL_53_29 TaxID=1798480 RepID=A0A1F6CUU4_9BACT|nr:MAG: hypothetical protein A2851_04570 [Candidatus Kaiserbacteria bacterium RIFCSPHIGHO2_01_FULL_53_29]